jgi:hypothetical protein
MAIFNEDVVYKAKINCGNAVELRTRGKYWYKARCK